MENLLKTNVVPEKKWIEAVYKDRWIGIFIKYDDFQKFTYDFIIPFSEFIARQEIGSSFYYNLGLAADDIIQLNFKTSQFKLEREFKPALFRALNSYFDSTYLASLNITEFDDHALDQKEGHHSMYLKKLKVLAVEEYSINPLSFSVGIYGEELISKLVGKSSAFILEGFKELKDDWTTQNAIEKSLALLFTVLNTFMKDREEMCKFLSWIIVTIFNQIEDIPGIPDLQKWKSEFEKDMEENFQQQKEALIGFSEYILDSLDQHEEFEETWLNDWVNLVTDCKNKLEKLDEIGRLPMLYDIRKDIKDPGEILILKGVDEKSLRDWQIVYYLMNTINGQLGLRFNLEYYIYYFMKRSLMETLGKHV